MPGRDLAQGRDSGGAGVSATGQRVRKTQPLGGLAGLGMSPLRIWRSALASGSGEGIAERSARV